MKKSELIAGKHWVETLRGRIGCIMNNGIVFKNESLSLDLYGECLTCILNNDYNIVKIYEVKPKESVGSFKNDINFNVLANINGIKNITTLNQLDEVCTELSTRVGDLFYMTNRNGKWEVKRDTLMGDVVVTDKDFKDLGYKMLVNYGK